jgi:hypothetical protein
MMVIGQRTWELKISLLGDQKIAGENEMVPTHSDVGMLHGMLHGIGRYHLADPFRCVIPLVSATKSSP